MSVFQTKIYYWFSEKFWTNLINYLYYLSHQMWDSWWQANCFHSGTPEHSVRTLSGPGRWCSSSSRWRTGGRWGRRPPGTPSRCCHPSSPSCHWGHSRWSSRPWWSTRPLPCPRRGWLLDIDIWNWQNKKCFPRECLKQTKWNNISLKIVNCKSIRRYNE